MEAVHTNTSSVSSYTTNRAYTARTPSSSLEIRYIGRIRLLVRLDRSNTAKLAIPHVQGSSLNLLGSVMDVMAVVNFVVFWSIRTFTVGDESEMRKPTSQINPLAIFPSNPPLMVITLARSGTSADIDLCKQQAMVWANWTICSMKQPKRQVLPWQRDVSETFRRVAFRE